MGNFNGYGKVWCDERVITNILCLNNLKKLYRVTYDSASDDTFFVDKNNSLINFTCSQNGLYFHDKDNRKIKLLNTVEKICLASQTNSLIEQKGNRIICNGWLSNSEIVQ